MVTGSSPEDRSYDKAKDRDAQQQPGWADGLRQLYDSVVDEPLPDAFMNLLAQLDDGDDKDRSDCEGETKGSERGRN